MSAQRADRLVFWRGGRGQLDARGALPRAGSGNHAPLDVIRVAPTVLMLAAVIVYPLVSAIHPSLFQICAPTPEGGRVGLGDDRILLGSDGFRRALLDSAPRGGPAQPNAGGASC